MRHYHWQLYALPTKVEDGIDASPAARVFGLRDAEGQGRAVDRPVALYILSLLYWTLVTGCNLCTPSQLQHPKVPLSRWQANLTQNSGVRYGTEYSQQF